MSAVQSGLSPGSLAIPITGDLIPFEKALKDAEQKAEDSSRRIEQKARIQMRMDVRQTVAGGGYQGAQATGLIEQQESLTRSFSRTLEVAGKVTAALVLVQAAIGALDPANRLVNFFNSNAVEDKAKAWTSFAEAVHGWAESIPFVGKAFSGLIGAIDPVTAALQRQISEAQKLSDAWDDLSRRRGDVGNRILDQRDVFSQRLLDAIGKDNSAGRRSTGDKSKDLELKGIDDLSALRGKQQAEVQKFRDDNAGAFAGQSGLQAQQAAGEALSVLLDTQQRELSNFREQQKNALKRSLEEDNDAKVAKAKETAKEIAGIEEAARISALRAAGKDAEAEASERLRAKRELIGQDPDNERRTAAINIAFEAKEREIAEASLREQRMKTQQAVMAAAGQEFKAREAAINDEIDARKRAGKEDLALLEQEQIARITSVEKERDIKLQALEEQRAQLEKQRFTEVSGGAAVVDLKRTVFGKQAQNEKVKVEAPDVVMQLQKLNDQIIKVVLS